MALRCARDRAPDLRFGAITDVQYADVEDDWSFNRTQLRRFRGVLKSLRTAVKDWSEGPPLEFVVDLGDIIDQQCEARGDSLRCLRRVLQEWEPLPHQVFHVLGNHELYNFDRARCAELIPGIEPWYRSFCPVPGWRVIILDAYDLNCVDRSGGAAVEEGLQYLAQRNPNDLRAPRGTVDVSQGLVGLEKRFLPMGGALRGGQLCWLRGELAAATAHRERAMVFTHVPLHPGSTVPGALLWNYEEVLEILRLGGRTVALVMAGHFHSGGYARDAETGTHHLTLPSPLHATAEEPDAHCVVEVWKDRIEVLGRGLVPSRTLRLEPLGPEQLGSRL